MLCFSYHNILCDSTTCCGHVTKIHVGGPSLHISWLKVSFNLTLLPQNHWAIVRHEQSSPRYKKGPPNFYWRLYWEVGKKTGKVDKAFESYAFKVKNDTEHKRYALTGRVKISNALPTPA